MKGRSTISLVVSSVLVAALMAGPASARATQLRVDAVGDEDRGSCQTRVEDVIPCEGVRPGASISFGGGTGGSCTMNFLFEGNDGYRYVGTGGHCIFDGEDLEGERVWRPGKGIEAYDAEENPIGKTAYWGLRIGKLDFGLIRLDAGIEANAEMCHFGGPTGIYKGVTSAPTVINFFGNQSVVGNVLPARELVAATGLPHKDRVDAFGALVFGDSGGPATLEDGRALGVVYAAGFGFNGLPGQPDFTVGNVFLVRLPSQIKAAEKAMKIDLRLLKPPR